MAYVLVMLRRGAKPDDEELHAAAHERFIGSLVRRNLVLLGGAFAEPVGDVDAAYLLRCSGVGEAAALAAEDPLAAHGVVRPECVEWQLVGINPDAIDAEAVLRPTDV